MPPTTTTTVPTTTSSSPTTWWPFGLAAVLVVLAALLVVLLVRRGRRAALAAWKPAVEQALVAAQAARDHLVRVSATPAQDVEWNAIQREVATVAATLASVAEASPNDEGRTASLSLSSSLEAMRHSVESARLASLGVDASQAGANEDVLIAQRALDLDLARLARTVRPEGARPSGADSVA